MNYSLNIACQTSALSKLRIFLHQALNEVRLNEIEKHQVTLAVEEVCSNLIIHSHGCNPEDSIQLEIKNSDQKLIVEISDQGQAFNILDYKAPDLKKVMVEKRKGGLGIILVRKIMDEIEFESENGTNTCRLIKWLHS
ncbi:ATP-binding protein [Algoriphagus sp.]|uniref:ATP-binding protein n=1 Tax=Algoriphagus sp. TaxID=1872435 RepID=UPI00391CBF21